MVSHEEKKRDLDRRKICKAKLGKKVRDKRIKVDERISSVLSSYLQLQQLVKVSNSLIRLPSPPTAQIQAAGWGQGPGPLRRSALGKSEQSTPVNTRHERKLRQQFTLAETLRDVHIIIICVHSTALSP